jgi:hypothetical protein
MKLHLKRDVRFAPRKPRIATAIDSTLLLPDDREVDIQIRNISPAGFMAQTDAELTVDTQMGVSIPGGGIRRAQVRWSEDGMLGAEFDQPLPGAVFEAGKRWSGK